MGGGRCMQSRVQKQRWQWQQKGWLGRCSVEQVALSTLVEQSHRFFEMPGLSGVVESSRQVSSSIKL